MAMLLAAIRHVMLVISLFLARQPDAKHMHGLNVLIRLLIVRRFLRSLTLLLGSGQTQK
jgi:hypothetical protein